MAPARNNTCSKIVSSGTNQAALITGSNRTQTLVVKVGNDTVGGGSGDDRTSGGAGDDSVYGRAGNDSLSDTRVPNTDAVDGDDLDILCRVPASGGTDNGIGMDDAGDDVDGLGYP